MVNINSILKKMANKLISLNSSKIDTATMHALYGTKTVLDMTWTTGNTNWTTAPTIKNAWLMGDKILIEINISRNSNWSAGNISNEVMGNFSIKTLGSISNAYSIAIPRVSNGPIVTMSIGNVDINGSGASQTLDFTITLAATHAAGKQISILAFIPVRPNLSYYGL